jgi:hypothetical protein
VVRLPLNFGKRAERTALRMQAAALPEAPLVRTALSLPLPAI